MDADQETYIQELEDLFKSAKHPKVQQLLQKAIAAAKPKQIQVESVSVKAETTTSKVPVGTVGMTRITNYGWDDAGKMVKIYISGLAGNEELTTEHVKVEFKETGLSLAVHNLKGKNYSLVFQSLAERILPAESSFKVSKGMITVRLQKTNPSVSWPCLTATEKKLKDAKEPKAPKYDKEADPSEGIMSLMKNMYQEGDDDMKRMIAKAWTESRDKKQADGPGMDLP